MAAKPIRITLMTDDFFDFLKTPSKELFMRSRAQLVQRPDYNAYSDDLRVLDRLLDEGRFDDAIAYRSHNLILSPRAQMLYAYAYAQKGMEMDENAASAVGHMIMENILLTGNGSLEQPYFVTRIEDERDVLMALNEKFASQALMQDNGRFLDCITSQSGNKIYFDITDCYTSMQKFSFDDFLDQLEKELEDKPGATVAPQKKWWQFWK